jgi:transcription elongation factor Elf1
MMMFTCERCGKELTEKSNMTRHQKTHAVSSQTYSCGVCDKVFSRPDHRKRHEASHNYSLTCGVCGQYFNRLDILARHRASTRDQRPSRDYQLRDQQHLNPDPSQSRDVPCYHPELPWGILLDQTCCQRTQRPEPSIDSIGSPFGQRKRPAIVQNVTCTIIRIV